MTTENANATENQNAAMVLNGGLISENAKAYGRFKMECIGADGKVKWFEEFDNVVTTEGKTAALQHFLKGSAYTADLKMGLIGNVGYSTPVVGDTMASHAGWAEAVVGVMAARKTPTVGTPSGGSVTFSVEAFSIVGTDTINGVFLACKSTAGTAPLTTVGNTQGALWSAGALSVARSVINGDTLNVTYTTGL